jgi:glucan phosphoethanolaminetransferase (alkaline phosphatase superfamily)
VIAGLLWLAAFSLSVLAAQLLGRALPRGSRIPGLIIAGSAGLQTAAFLLVYGGSYLSNRLWGDSLTLSIVESAIRNPAALLSFAGIAVSSVVAGLILLVVGGAIVLALAALWCAALRLFSASSEGGLIGASPVHAVVSLACCAVLSVVVIHYAPRAAKGEPILNFFGAAPSRNMLDMDEYRMAAALEARKDQLDYPPQRADVPRKNVVIILSDSIRADHLDVYGYPRKTMPFLSQLVESGRAVAFNTVLSTCSESYCGIASTLASLPFHKLSPQNFKLNSVLKRAGYRVSYFLSGEHRSWGYLWRFYGEDVDDKRDCVARNCTDQNDDAQLLADVRGLEPFDGKPRFFFFFLMSSHRVGTKHPEYEQFQPTRDSAGLLVRRKLERPLSFDAHGVPNYRPMTADEVEGLTNHYDNGLVQSDAMQREIFSVLQEKGYLKDSIVLFSSDHGESLGEDGHVLHGGFLYQRDIHIPLIIYDDPKAYPDRSYGAQIDIAPTILDRLGLPIPKSWEGVPLTRPTAVRSTVHQMRNRERPCAAAVERSPQSFVKYIRCRGPDHSIGEELFDLREDAGETRNIIALGAPDKIARWRDQIGPLVDDVVCSGAAQYCGVRKKKTADRAP